MQENKHEPETQDTVQPTPELTDGSAEETAHGTEEEPYTGILGDFVETEEETGDGQAPEPEQPKEKKEKKKVSKKTLTAVGITAAVVLLGCIGLAGVTLMKEQNNVTAVASTENMDISKEMLVCYYHYILDSYKEAYGEEQLLSYYQLDLSKSLKDQAYPANDGTTWYDQVMNMAKSSLSQMLMVAEAAKADGYEMTDEIEQQVEEEIADTDVSSYGNGVTIDDLRDVMRLQYYTQAYYEHYIDSMSYTDEELETYYNENKTTYDLCNIALFAVTYSTEDETADTEETSAEEDTADTEETSAEEDTADTEETSAEEDTADTEETSAEEDTADTEETSAEEDTADTEETSAEEETSDTEETSAEETTEPEELTQEEAKALSDELAAATDLASFQNIAREILIDHMGYTEGEELDSAVEALDNEGYQYQEGSELAEWAFGGAKVGETYVVESDGTYYVYMLTKEPARDESMTVNVRHILFNIQEHAGEDGDMDAAREECRQLAEDCLERYNEGDKTEDSFAALANELTEDPGSNTNGGLYENVYEGEMVQPFNDWCFDASRQPGDTDIVETDYGMHVMYFVGNAGEFWKTSVTNALKSQALSQWFTDLEGMYPVTFDEEAINTIEEVV